MKKLILNLSDNIFEKLRFESIQEEKDIPTLIKERMFHKPFSKEVEKAYDEWFSENMQQAMKD